MVDTARTRAALLTALADNGSFSITAQQLRDFVVSIYTAGRINVEAYKTGGNTWRDAFQAAHDAASAGDTLYFPNGTYDLNGYVDLTKAVKVAGEARAGVGFTLANDTSGIRLNWGVGTKVYGYDLRDFSIGSTSDRTAGAGLYIGNIGNSILKNVLATNAYGGRLFMGYQLEGPSQSRFDIDALGCASHGVYVHNASGAAYGCVDLWFESSCKFNQNLGCGVYIYNESTAHNLEGIYFAKSSIYGNAAQGIRVNAVASALIKTLFLDGTMLDTNTSYGLQIGGAGKVQAVQLNAPWVSANGVHGVFVQAAAVDCSIQGGVIAFNQGTGVYCEAGSRTLIHGTRNYSNNQGNSGGWGIVVDAGCVNTRIMANEIYNSPEGVASQSGVGIVSGATATRVLNNYVVTGGAAEIQDGATGSTVSGNVVA